MGRVAQWLGLAMVFVGIVLLLAVGALYGYGEYERIQFERELAQQTPLGELAPTPEPDATPEPVEIPRPPETAVAIATPVASPTTSATLETPTPVPSATAAATAFAQPSPTGFPNNPAPAQRILIPRIGLDAPVVESVIRNGEWVVPRFAAGHLSGTAQPGGPGNAVFAGHVASISAGNVFADIGKLNAGDRIVVRTAAGSPQYQVSRRFVVKNDDLTVTKDFGDERITLVTCTGVWMPIQRDFSHRTIVVATRVG